MSSQIVRIAPSELSTFEPRSVKELESRDVMQLTRRFCHFRRVKKVAELSECFLPAFLPPPSPRRSSRFIHPPDFIS